MCTLGLSGCRVEPRRTHQTGPPGLHTTTRELQTRTFERPGASNTTKIPRENPQRERRRNEISGGREQKKSAKFWAPHPSGPTLRAPNPSGPTFSGFGPPPLRGPHLSGSPPLRVPTPPGPHPSGSPPLRVPTNTIGQMRSGQIWSNKIGQIRPNQVGQMRPINFGQMWYWPNSVWPNAAK